MLAALAVLPTATVAAASAPAPALPPSGTSSVTVREAAGAGDDAARAVAAAGGRVGRRIGIIDGFEATLPASAVAALGGVAGVVSVLPNDPVELPATTASRRRTIWGRCTGWRAR